MSKIETTNAGHKITTSRGEHRGELSAQWASRPADQRFLSVDDLIAHFNKIETNEKLLDFALADAEIKVIESKVEDVDDRIEFHLPEVGAVEPSHWSFNQLCYEAGANPDYIRKCPAFLQEMNLNYWLWASTNERRAYLMPQKKSFDLRGVTSQTYGRILNGDVAREIKRVNDETGGRWKVPGMIDWGKMTHNPNVDVTTQSTTLYASDRDMFVFLCDDRNPIEIGKLDDGSPDYVFRGFIASNSDVGARRFDFMSFLLRGVCFNRNLWGVEDFQQFTIRHTPGAPARFDEEVLPALEIYAESTTTNVIGKVKAAKQLAIASTDEEAVDWLRMRGLSKKLADQSIETSLIEEQRPLRTIWDASQAVTAVARTIDVQENRVRLEQLAGGWMDKVAA